MKRDEEVLLVVVSCVKAKKKKKKKIDKCGTNSLKILVTTTDPHYVGDPTTNEHPKYSYAIKPVLSSQTSIRPIHRAHTGNN